MIFRYPDSVRIPNMFEFYTPFFPLTYHFNNAWTRYIVHHYLIYSYKAYISGLYSRLAASPGKYFFSDCHGQLGSPCRISGTTDGLKPSARKKRQKWEERA